ncbi:hypothetical protein J6590_038656 [Homalodisca vitripennis]|nr:hypothetical protein J6590_038656 [Homalodisca vitripennis]
MASSILLNPRHRTSTYNKSFVVTACRAWNSLPNHIKSVGSRNRFAALLKAKLLEMMSAMVLASGINIHLKRSKTISDEEAQNELSTLFRHQRHLNYKQIYLDEVMFNA